MRILSTVFLLATASPAMAQHIVAKDSGSIYLNKNESEFVEARCAENETVVSGGFIVRLHPSMVTVEASYPMGNLEGWHVAIRNITDQRIESRVAAEAICIERAVKK